MAEEMMYNEKANCLGQKILRRIDMNKGKKLLSLLLAFVLVFALCGTAFAADATAGEMAG